MTNYNQYYDYLKSRSRMGLLYRNLVLYPRLSRELKGLTLDIGCGIGDFLKFRKKTIGVDINPQTVAYCKSKNLNAHLMEIDQIPFKDNFFDCAILDNVLEHIVDPSILIKEIFRVTKADCTLIIGVPEIKGFSADIDHKVFYDEKILAQVMTQNGWQNENFFHMPFKSNFMAKKFTQFCLYGVFRK